MSYCRWSNEDYTCPVYVYESDRGFETHVARSRPVWDDRLPPKTVDDDCEPDGIPSWVHRFALVTELVSDMERADYNLPFDGESFTHDTAAECADNLEHLREVGYEIPQYAIDALRAEEEA